MVDQDLEVINTSGALIGIQLGNTLPAGKVLVNSEIETLVDDKVKVTDDKVVALDARVTQNTNDVGTNDTAIGANTDAIVILQNPPATQYAPQATAPIHSGGQIYYDNVTGTLDVQGAYADVTLQVGREQHIEVINETGVTITNGQACRHNGVSAGRIRATPALADSFSTSFILGVATHDILIGEKGLLTTFGIISGLDTTGFTPGTAIYLSDTVPGGWVAIAPQIVSQIGGILTADATTGQVFVKINSNMTLPTIYASLADAANLGTLTGSVGAYTPLTNYAETIVNSMTTDLVGGTITVPNTGVYRTNVFILMSFDNVGGGGKKDVWVAIYNLTDASYATELRSFILKDAESFEFSGGALTDLNAGDQYRLEIRSELTLTGCEFYAASFDFESIRIR